MGLIDHKLVTTVYRMDFLIDSNLKRFLDMPTNNVCILYITCSACTNLNPSSCPQFFPAFKKALKRALFAFFDLD